MFYQESYSELVAYIYLSFISDNSNTINAGFLILERSTLATVGRVLCYSTENRVQDRP